MVDKIKLVPVTGANNIVNINDNFEKIERTINNTMLSRKVGVGEPNQLLNAIDMNNNRIYNLPAPQSPTEPLTAGFIGDLTETVAQGQANIAASNILVQKATIANEEARQILEDTHLALDESLGAINTQTQQSINQIDSIGNVIIADVTSKQQDVANKAATVNTQAGQVNTQSAKVAVDAAAAAASASGAASSAATASTQGQLAQTAATTATSAASQAAVSKDLAVASAASAKLDADRAEAAATGQDPVYLLDRANHTGTQAISTVEGLQVALDNKFGTSSIIPVINGGTGANNAATARINLGLGSAAVAPILGIVSQSSGVPTGAIIQRGSNANGDFIRYADGTQICMREIVIASREYVAGAPYEWGNWMFPAVFIVRPLIPQPSSHGGWSMDFIVSAEYADTAKLGQVTIKNIGAVSRTQGRYVSLLAIGRWF